MRRNGLVAAFAIVALLSFVSLAPAPAYADPGNGPGQGASPPGNNGTIKVHNGDGEPGPAVENEPQENETKIGGCTFHIHGFNFDPRSSGTWRIVAWPPTGDGQTVVASGTWTANASGEWRTAVMSLASGHYKAFAKQTGSPGGEKQKVFWIDCAGAVGGTASPTPTPAAPTPTPTPVVGAGTSPAPTPTQLGVQQPPLTGGVSPIVETGGAPAGQASQVTAPVSPAVQGAEQAPVAGPAQAQAAAPLPGQVQAQSVPQPLAPAQISGLPSTSTAPVGLSGSLALFSALAALAWRRPRR